MRNYRVFLIAILLGFLPVAAYANIFDATDLLRNMQTHLPAVMSFIVATSYVMGIALIINAVMKLKAYGQQTASMSTNNASIGGPAIMLAIGLVLMYLPTTTDHALITFFGYGSDMVPGYEQGAGLDWNSIFSPIIDIVKIVGYIAFIRGWMLLVRVGQHSAQPGTVSKAIIHIVGGIFAINIVGTWEVIQNTFQFIL